MKEEVIQQDFGGFNPRFMGICIKFQSPETLQMWQKYLTSDGAVPQSSSSLLEIATRSVLDHEVRHYHDSLISPYSTYLLRMRIQGLLNGVQVFNEVADRDGDCLPVPLSTWIKLNATERQEQIKEWDSAKQPPNKSWRPISVQMKTEEELLEPLPAQIIDVSSIPPEQVFDIALEWTIRSYLRIQQVVRGFASFEEHPEIKPCNIYEATALTVQWHSIHQSQGELEAAKFAEYLFNSDVGYAVIWQRFFQLARLLDLERPGPDKVEGQLSKDIMKLAVWCLLGNYELEGGDACPTIRFSKLLMHIFKEFANSNNWRGSIADVWSYWDAKTGVRPWRDCLEHLLLLNERGLESYIKMGSLISEGIKQALTTTMSTFLKEQRQMVKLMLERPEQLVEPGQYLNAEEGKFPIPHCKVELENFGVSLSSIKGFESLWTIQKSGKLYSTRFAFRPGSLANDPTVLNAAVELEGLMNWCDVAFSDHNPPPEVYEITRRDIAEHARKDVFLVV